jgi:hypothetical protein
MEDPMRKVIALSAIVLLPLFACGGDSSSPGQAGGAEGATPPVSAANPDVIQGALESVTDPSVTQCLDLVKASRFGEAVPVCTRAAAADPDNADVKAALENARSKFAEAEAQAAKEALEKSAAEAASDLEAQKAGLEAQKAELEAAKEGLKGQLPR